MDSGQHIRLLQTAYAGALADATLQFGKEGVLPGITDRKRQENIVSGRMRAGQFGITKPEEVFLRLSELFGCANWDISNNHDGFTARTNSCMLCAIAKKTGAPSPCRLYCLDPMEGLLKGIEEKADFVVRDTLWASSECNIQVVLGERAE